jgi:hypothetical protein
MLPLDATFSLARALTDAADRHRALRKRAAIAQTEMSVCEAAATEAERQAGTRLSSDTAGRPGSGETGRAALVFSPSAARDQPIIRRHQIRIRT